MEYKRYADIKRLEFILDSLKNNIPDNGLVLDVGCGNGIISRGVGTEGYTVIGIDVSDKAIQKAQSLTTLPNVSFQVVSAEQLVSTGETYDAVICSEVLEHLSDPQKLLSVLYKSVKDNGILLVTVPNGFGPRETLVTKPVISLQKRNNWVWRVLLKIKSKLGYSGTTIQSDADDLTHIQFFTKKSLNNLASQTNFKIISFGKTNFIDDVFPISLLTRRLKILQKWDAAVAERLPYNFTGGFVTVWQKKIKNHESVLSH